ncbi:hypothetical protein I3760_14G134300 [Carya illinoinensis]|nr:hypothetical protein I3760_14G134300 [Carya illinoinensis]
MVCMRFSCFKPPMLNLQLFSLSAFDKTHPTYNYKDLSMDFVKYARGLPLALIVLGRSLCKKTIEIWKDARDHLEAIPRKEIFDILKISFDGLEISQQQLFLDAACFCPRFWPLCDYFKKIYPAIDIDVLVNKSLVSKSEYGCEELIVHDLLKKMGQEIVHREDPNEPGRRSRLFGVEDVYDVLKNDTGTDAIEGIFLDLNYAETKHGEFNAEAFSKMRKLRFLYFDADSEYIKWHGNPFQYMPSDKLRFLHWRKCPSKSWPSSFQPKNLIVLSMPNSCFKQLWEGLMVLDNLKYLDLSYSKNLIETPDLSGAPNLEKINLEGCTNLCEVHPSIGALKQLQKIIIGGTRIKQLWKETLVILHNLKELDLCYCENLIETPDLSRVPNLEKIQLKCCTSLCKVHPSIGFLKRLKHLSLDGCSRLGNFLNILGDVTSLESLSLPSSEVTILPSVIYSLSSLETLRLDGWSRLEKFPDLSMLECLKEFKAYGSTAISQIPSINLIPKSICSLELKGGKRMPRESRDLVMFINDCSLPKQSSYPTNHYIGSPVEYEMEEKLWVRINFFGDLFRILIQRCSLGSRVPEWVHNKSNGSSLFFDMCNGSSLKIESDGNTMSVMGIAIFIVCQFHSISPVNLRGYETVAFRICLDDDTPENDFCQFHFALSTDFILDKPIVLTEYIWNPGYLESWKLKSLDKRKISTTATFMDFASQTPFMEVEVKEWGLHLVCPDDGRSSWFGIRFRFLRQFY